MSASVFSPAVGPIVLGPRTCSYLANESLADLASASPVWSPPALLSYSHRDRVGVLSVPNSARRTPLHPPGLTVTSGNPSRIPGPAQPFPIPFMPVMVSHSFYSNYLFLCLPLPLLIIPTPAPIPGVSNSFSLGATAASWLPSKGQM